MVIFFEPLLVDPNLIKELPIESLVLLNEIHLYVEGRLKPLKDEIDKEEVNEEEGKPRSTRILFPKGMKFDNYSESLVKKMKNCFNNSENDIELLWLKFDDKIRALFN